MSLGTPDRHASQQRRHSRQSTTRKKRTDLVSLGGKLVLHGDHLHEVNAILAPILKKSNGGVQSQISEAALVQQTNTHILDIPCSHPVVNLHRELASVTNSSNNSKSYEALNVQIPNSVTNLKFGLVTLKTQVC